MGILRTDKISGLETPTAVTGSVSFDGTDDGLIIADHGDTFDFLKNDFTVECWIYPRGGASSSFGGIWSKGQSYQLWWKEDTERIEVYASSDGSNYNILNAVNSGNGSVPANQWSHIAHTREGDTFRIFVNGILTSSATSSSTIISNTNAARIADYDPDPGTYELDGEISNLRVLKGTALYTENFTPPTHALEVIKDTIILCCNNPDSVTASAFAGIGTAYAITTAGNPTVATRDPGLTRDFTYGTEFRGVTTFDTQGYFVPPSGTTTDRDRSGTRALSMGGYYTPVNHINDIYYINTESTGNSQIFGELSLGATHVNTGTSDSTRGISAGGQKPGSFTDDDIQFVTIATTGNSVDFGNLSQVRAFGVAAGSNGTRGTFAGGVSQPSPNAEVDTIDYITIQALGNAIDFGNLTAARKYAAASMCSPVRHVFAGGQEPTTVNTIEYITMATLGNSADFGDLSNDARNQNSGGISSSSVRGIIMGGSAPGVRDHIEYITIATLGNSQDFGNLPSAGSNAGNASSKTRAIRMGNASPSYLNTISYVQIASTGDAMDFGDLNTPIAYQAACSNGHGGLS